MIHLREPLALELESTGQALLEYIAEVGEDLDDDAYKLELLLTLYQEAVKKIKAFDALPPG